MWISMLRLSHSINRLAKVGSTELLSKQYVIIGKGKGALRQGLGLMYRSRKYAFWLRPLWGKGPSPTAEKCHMEFVCIGRRKQFHLFPLSLLCIPESKWEKMSICMCEPLLLLSVAVSSTHRQAASIQLLTLGKDRHTPSVWCHDRPRPRPHTHTHNKTNTFNMLIWKVKCSKEIASATLMENVMRWNCLCIH